MKSSARFILIAATLLASAAHAQVTVKNAWVRATVPQQKATGAFVEISSPKDTKLVSVSTPATPVAEIHQMSMQDNVMQMRQVPGIDIAAGKVLALKPGGYHVMLLDLDKQVKEGDIVPLTFVFEDKDGQRESVEIKAPARALNAGMKPAAHGAPKH